jgi:cytoskeletal protein RodZ
MLWAVLGALGVAIVSMTVFGARLTRRNEPDTVVEHLDTLEDSPDPSDPWAAWKPRPFEELDRPRPRMWPLLAGLTGLVLVGAGFAGARQTLGSGAEPTSTPVDPTSNPAQVEVAAPPTPTPVPATPAPTRRPVAAAPRTTASAPATASNGSGPTISASPSCAGGTMKISYTLTAHGASLAWVAVYADGKVAKGGPVSGNTFSSSYSAPATSGSHALEVSAEDKAGKTARKQYQVRCP